MTALEQPIQVDPAMVLTRVQQGSELGAALVRAATMQVLAEHHAAEAASLREQLAAARGETPPDTSTSSSDEQDGETTGPAS